MLGTFGSLVVSIILAVVVLGGPFTLFFLIKYFNYRMGSLKVTFRASPKEQSADAPAGILIDWDSESYPYAICRVRIDFYEMIRGGRSDSFSFTFEDKASKKKSFFIPMKLSPAELDMFRDAGLPGQAKALARSFVNVEVEDTNGNTVRKKIKKSEIRAELQMAPLMASPDIDVLPATAHDAWSVLTRVFPWRRVVATAPVEAAPKDHAKKEPGAPKAAAPVDFLVTKVWIEPGCIVCDACENEAPAVFHVLADTCIVRENAPLGDGASIKAAAEGCPVNVIKFDTVPKPA